MNDLKFRNLFITGKTGVGKTFHAKQIMEQSIIDWNEFKKQQIEERNFNVPDGEKIFKIFNCSELMFLARKTVEGTDLYFECIRAKGLILDDLGVGKRSDFIPDIIYIIIDKRLELGKPTIVTSNVNLQAISDMIDDRLASRLASFEYMEIKGKDRRVK